MIDSTWSLLRSGALAASSLALVGCSLVIRSDRVQCKVDADCQSLASSAALCVESVCKPDPKWACLGKQPKQGSNTVSVTLRIANVAGGGPLAGQYLRMCFKEDCTIPQTNQVVTDSTGSVTVSLPANFDGFAAIQSTPFTGSGPEAPIPISATNIWYSPVFLALPPPLPATTILTKSTYEALKTIYQGQGAPLNPAESHAFMQVSDCTGTPVSGAKLTTKNATAADSAAFYLSGGLPDPKAEQTDATGVGGFVNLPLGVATFTASRSDGATIGIASCTMAADTLSYLEVPAGLGVK